MKTMLISDFCLVKQYMIQQLIAGAFLGVVLAFAMQNIYAIVPIVSITMTCSIAFTIIALDEREKWEQFRLALPLSRTDIIAGRYAGLFIVTVIGIVFGLLVMGLVMAAAFLFPDEPYLAALLVDFSWQTALLVSIIPLAGMLCFMAIFLPVVAYCGMTKAVRLSPVFLFVSVMLIALYANSIALPSLISNFIDWVCTVQGTIIFAVIALVASCALYAGSGSLAARLYKTREF